jgi:hypothetical protein
MPALAALAENVKIDPSEDKKKRRLDPWTA